MKKHLTSNEVLTITDVDLELTRTTQDPHTHKVIGFEGSVTCEHPITGQSDYDLGTGEFGLEENQYDENGFENGVGNVTFKVDYRPALRALGVEFND